MSSAPIEILRQAGADVARAARRVLSRAVLPRRDGFWLVVQLSDSPEELRAAISPFGQRPAPSLVELLEILDSALRDPQVDGVLLRIGGPLHGISRVLSLRRAVQAFRAAGKPVAVYAETLEAESLLLASAAAAKREAEKAARAGKRRSRIIGGIGVLLLLLGVQVLHQSREKLATIPAFNNVVGPMYRAIGKPLSPAWDITGWRFEVTKGSTDEGDQNLTIYSRIGNKSDKPLPYPLVAISLTDRFEETVGSRILDPVDYLPNDLDPRKLVQPGNTFNAVITIQSPAKTATGFKLNVCYREAGGQLRCAIDDFK